MSVEIDVQEMVQFLVQEHGYSERAAKGAANKVAASSPAIRSAYVRWRETGELVADLAVAGYSWSQLVAEYNMKAVGALVTLDWLHRDPDKAGKALERGYDEYRVQSDD